jgi:N-acetylglucosamine-6-phosphate deacetylase
MSDGTLAGSLSLLDTGIALIVQAGYPLAAALTAATRTPADLLRLPELGRLAPGAIARLIHVNPATGALVGALRG